VSVLLYFEWVHIWGLVVECHWYMLIVVSNVLYMLEIRLSEAAASLAHVI
jgi:hypothetical protein